RSRAAQCCKAVNRAEITVGKVKQRTDMVVIKPDKKGLAKIAHKGQQKAKSQKTEMFVDKAQGRHGGVFRKITLLFALIAAGYTLDTAHDTVLALRATASREKIMSATAASATPVSQNIRIQAPEVPGQEDI